MKKLLTLILTSVCFLPLMAQEDLLDVIKPKENSYVREGNEAYEAGDFAKSEVYYKKAREKNANGVPSNFNLGDAMFQQGRFEEAAQQFDLAANLAEDPAVKAKALHNEGNAFVKAQKYKEAVEAYKDALRYNSKDEDTRYNLAYALAQYRQQQQQQQQNQEQQQDQQEGQEGEEGEQQEGQQQDQQEQQEQEQQNEQGEEEQSKKGEMQNPKMSKDEIERMLEALRFQEEKLQEELQRAKAKGQKVRVDKDW